MGSIGSSTVQSTEWRMRKDLQEFSQLKNEVTYNPPTISDIENYIRDIPTGMKVEDVVQSVYNNLPILGQTQTVAGPVAERGASIMNDRYLQLSNGDVIQFRRKGGKWTVNIFKKGRG